MKENSERKVTSFNSQEWRGRSEKSPAFRPSDFIGKILTAVRIPWDESGGLHVITFALCITYIWHYVHLLFKVWLRLHRSEGTPELSVYSPIL